MANTVKLKRGSGSNPGSSDLAVGEIAVRTDEGKLFTKKDDGSIAEISGGSGGIDDGGEAPERCLGRIILDDRLAGGLADGINGADAGG